MTSWRKAKLAALASVAALAMASTTVGGTQAAFTGETNEGLNVITAMPDFRGPTVSPIAIGKDSGGATGFIKTGATYRIYAQVTDVGAPPSGTATVNADASNVTAGQVAVPLVAGSYTAGGVSYNYRSAVLTAGALANGPQPFTVTATDVAANVTQANGSVMVDSTAPAASNISAQRRHRRPARGRRRAHAHDDRHARHLLAARELDGRGHDGAGSYRQPGRRRPPPGLGLDRTDADPVRHDQPGAQRLHHHDAQLQRLDDDAGRHRDQHHPRSSRGREFRRPWRPRHHVLEPVRHGHRPRRERDDHRQLQRARAGRLSTSRSPARCRRPPPRRRR